jgi:cytosine permease
LWVGFYLKLGGPTIAYAGIGVCLAALFTAGCLCVALYYHVPAMVGMKSGCPLYVVGSSTFGAVGGYVMPGLLMGLLQVGWIAATASVAIDFVLKGLNRNSKMLAAVLLLAWIYGLAWVATKGIHYVARVANVFNCVTLAMILIVFWENRSGIPAYMPPSHHPLFGGDIEKVMSTLVVDEPGRIPERSLKRRVVELGSQGPAVILLVCYLLRREIKVFSRWR